MRFSHKETYQRFSKVISLNQVLKFRLYTNVEFWFSRANPSHCFRIKGTFKQISKNLFSFLLTFDFSSYDRYTVSCSDLESSKGGQVFKKKKL